MFKQKLSISINSDFDRAKLYNAFETLMSDLWRTGQIIGNDETPFVSGNELISYHTTLERTSLSRKYFDEFARKRVNEIQQWCKSALRSEVAGKALPGHKVVCKCKEPAFYILFTHVRNHSGFIECGTCGKTVPLYKLPQLAYDDRLEMLSWEANYKACDDLQLGCTVGEQWAIKQMSDPKSPLSRQGIAICDRIRERTGVATYYYLFNYRHLSKAKDRPGLCPSCHKKWTLKERILDFYDFKCDKCRLLSTVSLVTT